MTCIIGIGIAIRRSGGVLERVWGIGILGHSACPLPQTRFECGMVKLLVPPGSYASSLI